MSRTPGAAAPGRAGGRGGPRRGLGSGALRGEARTLGLFTASSPLSPLPLRWGSRRPGPWPERGPCTPGPGASGRFLWPGALWEGDSSLPARSPPPGRGWGWGACGPPTPRSMPPLRARTYTGWGGGWSGGVGKSGSGVRPLPPPRRALGRRFTFFPPFPRPLLGNALWPTSTSTKIKIGSLSWRFLESTPVPFSRAHRLQSYLGNFDSSPPNYWSLLHPRLC